jgi:hypothetical protein
MGLISDTLDRYAATRAKTFSGDRSQTLGASEVGQCARKMFWLKNEDDPTLAAKRDPDYVDTWGAWMRGIVYEDHFWVPAMRARFKDRLMFAGEEQDTLSSGFLSATPDGMITKLTPAEKKEIGTQADCVLVECKTADPRTNLAEAKPANVFQTHVQMGLMRECTKYQPDHAIISYTDTSFWNEVKEFVVTFDPQIYAVAQERARMVMTATSVNETKPEGWFAGGAECRWCPFTIACGIERRNLPFADEQVDEQFKAEMYDMALDYKKIERKRDLSETELRVQQNAIKERLRDKGVRKIPGVLTWSTVKGRVSYDNKAIREALQQHGVDIEKFSTVGEATDRLVIQIATE